MPAAKQDNGIELPDILLYLGQVALLSRSVSSAVEFTASLRHVPRWDVGAAVTLSHLSAGIFSSDEGFSGLAHSSYIDTK